MTSKEEQQSIGDQETVFRIDLAIAANNQSPGLIRETAQAIINSGYLSLGDFFAQVKDSQLGMMMELFQSTHPVDPNAAKSLAALRYLTVIVLAGEGQYDPSLEEIDVAAMILGRYCLYETVARPILNTKQMTEKRRYYTLDYFADKTCTLT